MVDVLLNFGTISYPLSAIIYSGSGEPTRRLDNPRTNRRIPIIVMPPAQSRSTSLNVPVREVLKLWFSSSSDAVRKTKRNAAKCQFRFRLSRVESQNARDAQNASTAYSKKCADLRM